MTDGHGRTVDFKNTIIIMTSNVGSQWIQELGVREREKMEQRVMDALRATFKPEFLNRIDEIIIFRSLTLDQIGAIVEIQVERLARRLAERKIALRLTDAAKRLIGHKGYDPVYGARPLKRAIQQSIENPLAVEILKGRFPEGSEILADADGDRITFTRR
jgi:ATP-dependent Clp protease ATP-binding subunit ClpB